MRLNLFRTDHIMLVMTVIALSALVSGCPKPSMRTITVPPPSHIEKTEALSYLREVMKEYEANAAQRFQDDFIVSDNELTFDRFSFRCEGSVLMYGKKTPREEVFRVRWLDIRFRYNGIGIELGSTRGDPFVITPHDGDWQRLVRALRSLGASPMKVGSGIIFE